MGQQEVIASVHPFIEESNEVLRQKGYRLTPQRYIILKVLQETQEHLSVEQILERIQRFYPSIKLSTVYRTLDLLKDLKLVRETYFPGEHHPKYEAFTGKTHHHLLCQTCGTIMHLDEIMQEELHTLLQEHYHFHSLTLDMMSAGYCDPCWTMRQPEGAQAERITHDSDR